MRDSWKPSADDVRRMSDCLYGEQPLAEMLAEQTKCTAAQWADFMPGELELAKRWLIRTINSDPTPDSEWSRHAKVIRDYLEWA